MFLDLVIVGIMVTRCSVLKIRDNAFGNSISSRTHIDTGNGK
jgi:hypothetical protein